MDEVFDFVRGAFGADQLQVVPAELVAPLTIPERSKRFLLTVGLPRTAFVGGGDLEFNLLDRLPTLRQLLPEYADRLDPQWDLSLVGQFGVAGPSGGARRWGTIPRAVTPAACSRRGRATRGYRASAAPGPYGTPKPGAARRSQSSPRSAPA